MLTGMTNRPNPWLERLRHGAGGRGGAALAVLGLTGLALCAALVWTALHRGPWYDEFYTWFVARPDRPFGQGLRESWLADNHPPLFDMLAWLAAHLAGRIETLRLLNLAGLIAAMAGGWALLRRAPQHWPMAALFLLLLAGNEMTLRVGAEARSYLLSLCASAVAILALTCGWLEGELRTRSQRIALWAALLVGFNLHILTSVILGAALVPFLAAALLRGRKALFWQVLPPALAGGLLFVAVSLIQLPLWQANTAAFWIPPGLSTAVWGIVYGVQRALEANVLVLAGGLTGAGLLGWQALRSRRLSPPLEAMVLLALGLALAAALLVALHLLRPVVMERYLVALIPAVAMGVVLGAAELLRRLPGGAAAVALLLASTLTLWSLAANAEHTARRNSWESTAARLGELHRRCPDSPVHVDPAYWNGYTMALPPADNRMVLTRAYPLMAARHGVALEPPQSRRISARCPTLFWAEHDTRREWDEAAILAHLRAQGFAIAKVWQYRIGDGWIASDRPLDAGQPAR